MRVSKGLVESHRPPQNPTELKAAFVSGARRVPARSQLQVAFATWRLQGNNGLTLVLVEGSRMRQTPDITLSQLIEIFPDFAGWFGEEENEDALIDGVHTELTHHRVMMEFLGFFGKSQAGFSDAQLRAFGNWIDRAIAVDDDLGEAVSSCVLQRTHEGHISRKLAPFLSARAKAKSDA